MNQTDVPVLNFHQYSGGRRSQSVYSTRYFCGACRKGIGGVYGSACYGFPEYPEDLEAKNESEHGWLPHETDKGPLEYYSFCPWCGVQFAEEWWKDRTIQNERIIDHYQNPGHHKGDTHEFRGSGPDCMQGHWLGVSGGDKLCWCEPEVAPGLMGCIIRHQATPFSEYQAEKEREAVEARERQDAYVQVPGDHPEHDSSYCWYCDGNSYDSEGCDKCGGGGKVDGEVCGDCEGHGFSGYSW